MCVWNKYNSYFNFWEYINTKNHVFLLQFINDQMKIAHWLNAIYVFYRDGFKSMTVGKTLWGIALIKLFIMFAVLKVFFFPDYLNARFKQDKDKANYVETELVSKSTVSEQPH